ncbi:MAG: SPOR domain-containing protein, partial [Deltaproteobacteria bacterium]|nr:SPOR domain-containing protein [Deltaproteobacteria bacterium]
AASAAAATKPAAPAQPAAPSSPAPVGEAAEEGAAAADKPEDKAPKAGRPPAGKYVVQIKAFRNQAEADVFAGELRAKGYTVSVSAVEVPDKGQFFRVRMGPFGTLDAARNAQKKLETAEGHQTIVLATP